MTRDRRILIKNIYHMLSYAFSSLNHEGFQNVAKEEFDNIQNMFAAILSRGVNLQLKQGLYKEYVEKTEDLSVIHGKINLQGTIRNKIEKRKLVTCDFDELSENNLFNQIIKSSMMLLLSSSEVEEQYKKEMKKSLLFFSTIDEVADLKNIQWSSIRFQRNNQSYRLLLGICQLMIEGMIITTDKGLYKIATFVDDQKMWHLFQNFILEYYKKHYPELRPHSPQIPWDVPESTDMTLLPTMQTDIVLHNKPKTLIIDAKYYSKSSFQKQYDKQTIMSGNLYQIYTYVKNYDNDNTGNVSGLLLYAKTDEDLEPRGDYMMGKNHIGVDYLDLSVEFEDIRGKLDSIVERELAYASRLSGITNNKLKLRT